MSATSGKPSRSDRPKHDAAYKSLFAQRRIVADTLRAVGVGGDGGGLAGHFDLATLERMPASFVTEHLGRRSADMLWSVRARGATWRNLLVLFEFQSTVERRMPLRMMNYAGGVWMGLESSRLGPEREFPFVLPVVVYNGQPRWTAPLDVRDLLAPAPGRPLGSRPRHPYVLVELQRLDLSGLRENNVLRMIAALERTRSPKRLGELALSLRGWLARVGAVELETTFNEWISEVLAQRRDSKGGTLDYRIRGQEGPMTTLIERARQWGDALNREWLEKGLEKGRSEGRLEGERELVRRQVCRRFGPEAADELGPVLDTLPDPESVTAIGDAVVECRTAEEFRARVTRVAGK